MFRGHLTARRWLVIGIANTHPIPACCGFVFCAARHRLATTAGLVHMSMGLLGNISRNVTGNFACVDVGYHVQS